jgi:hypothetical protein
MKRDRRTEPPKLLKVNARKGGLIDSWESAGVEIWLSTFARMLMAPPQNRLRWLGRFIAEDLDATTPKDRARLGAELSGMRPMSEPGETWAADASPGMSLPEATLRELQKIIRDGLLSLLGGGRWSLPVPRAVTLQGATTAKSGQPAVRELHWSADESTAILFGVAKLIREHGEPLHLCERCRAPFYKVKRQTFCTPLCAQAARDEKKAAAKRPPKKGSR